MSSVRRGHNEHLKLASEGTGFAVGQGQLYNAQHLVSLDGRAAIAIEVAIAVAIAVAVVLASAIARILVRFTRESNKRESSALSSFSRMLLPKRSHFRALRLIKGRVEAERYVIAFNRIGMEGHNRGEQVLMSCWVEGYDSHVGHFFFFKKKRISLCRIQVYPSGRWDRSLDATFRFALFYLSLSSLPLFFFLLFFNKKKFFSVVVELHTM